MFRKAGARRRVVLQTLLATAFAAIGCSGEGARGQGARDNLSGGGADGGGAAGSAAGGSTGGSTGGSAGEGGAGGAGGMGGAATCTAERHYECASAQGSCPGVQRCAQTGQPGDCICAPSCGGLILGTTFEASSCRVAFTVDPASVGEHWEDALTVSLSEDAEWDVDEVIHRTENASSCADGAGWFLAEAQAFELCPTSCAAVIAGTQFQAVLGCPTVWRADSP